jgi:hypothetical protein
VIRGDTTPNTTRCIIRTPFAGLLGSLVTETEEDEGEDPNLKVFQMQMLDVWESGGESRNGE